MVKEIQSSLFNNIEAIAKALEANKTEKDKDKRDMNFYDAKNNFHSFIQNFYIQFFMAFNLQIYGTSNSAILSVNEFFSKKNDSEKPKNVISSFLGVKEISDKLKNAVYKNRLTDITVKELCLAHLSELCSNFEMDKDINKKSISNYDQINSLLISSANRIKDI